MTITLNDGVEMPRIGFGTSGVRLAAEDDDQATAATSEFLQPQRAEGGNRSHQDSRPGEEEAAYHAVKFAISVGYRFLDSASLYLNERAVGRAVNDAVREGLVLDRSELFVCTKLWNTAHERKSVERACRESLERLQLDYIDLYLIHWPVAYSDGGLAYDQAGKWINPRDSATGKLLYSPTHFTETWLGMEDVRAAGLVRSIGLSNFNSRMISEILAMPGLRFKPSVLQVELHPYLSQQKLENACKAHKIALNAYCPLGAPGASWLPAGAPLVIEDPLVKELAKRHKRSPAQVILRYHIQRNIVPIPKSNRPRRIRENLKLFDFSLSDAEMVQLLELNQNIRYCLNTAGEYVTDHPLYPWHETE